MAGIPIRKRGAPLEMSPGRRIAVLVLETFLYIVWLGSLAGVALIAAPAAFAHAPAEVAGAIVGASLRALTVVAWICGGLTLVIWLARIRREGRMALLGALLVAATDYAQWSIAPRMDAIVEAVHGPLASLPQDDVRRTTFDALHRRSTGIYGAVLVFGFAAAALAAARRPADRR
ncbi:DUF4149 domain-containing protein [bacterium]|nr:MAG: DUF4149 domain-containing protein [bacterium]